MKSFNHRQSSAAIVLIVFGILLIVSVPVVLQLQNRLGVEFSAENQKQPAHLEYISLDVAKTALYQEKAVFIDIRTKELYIINHIEDAVNIPFSELKVKLPSELKNSWIILYSQDSADFNISAASELLFDEGISKVNILKGGLDSWNKLGYPAVSLP